VAFAANNYWRHSVVTAIDFGISGPAWHRFFCFAASGGLNHQVEHHLFPTVRARTAQASWHVDRAPTRMLPQVAAPSSISICARPVCVMCELHALRLRVFAQVCHCHHAALHPLVSRLCDKHGVSFVKRKGYIDALEKHLEHTDAMGVEPATMAPNGKNKMM
jgi:hypothetical protein